MYVQAWLTVNGLETRLENSDELTALQLEIQLIGNHKSLRTSAKKLHKFVRIKAFDK